MDVKNFKYDDFEYDKPLNIIYNKITGEVYDATKDNVDSLITLKKKEDGVRRAKEKELKKSIGIEDLSENHDMKWMTEVHFIQTYRTINEEVSRQTTITKDEAMLLYIFDSRIEFRTNRITLKDGSSITNSDIEKLANMGRDKVAKTLNSLEDKRFIRRTGSTSAREIYYNPYLKSAGNEMSKKTIELFETTPDRPG